MQINEIFTKLYAVHSGVGRKKIEGVDEVGCRVVSKFSGFPDHISFLCLQPGAGYIGKQESTILKRFDKHERAN